MDHKIIEQYIGLLGYRAKDVITEFTGVITSLSFDLYGCVQAILTPAGVDKDGKTMSGHWFDINRLKIEGKKRVMPVPEFAPMKTYSDGGSKTSDGPHGPAEKPNSERY